MRLSSVSCFPRNNWLRNKHNTSCWSQTTSLKYGLKRKLTLFNKRTSNIPSTPKWPNFKTRWYDGGFYPWKEVKNVWDHNFLQSGHVYGNYSTVFLTCVHYHPEYCNDPVLSTFLLLTKHCLTKRRCAMFSIAPENCWLFPAILDLCCTIYVFTSGQSKHHVYNLRWVLSNHMLGHSVHGSTRKSSM